MGEGVDDGGVCVGWMFRKKNRRVQRKEGETRERIESLPRESHVEVELCANIRLERQHGIHPSTHSFIGLFVHPSSCLAHLGVDIGHLCLFTHPPPPFSLGLGPSSTRLTQRGSVSERGLLVARFFWRVVSTARLGYAMLCWAEACLACFSLVSSSGVTLFGFP